MGIIAVNRLHQLYNLNNEDIGNSRIVFLLFPISFYLHTTINLDYKITEQYQYIN